MSDKQNWRKVKSHHQKSEQNRKKWNGEIKPEIKYKPEVIRDGR